MTGRVKLRDVTEADIAVFFEQQSDPAASAMAAFTVKDPADRAAFQARWAGITADGTITKKTVLAGGRVAGHVLRFEEDGRQEVSYWIGRAYWGRGIATRALEELLALLPERPLYARVVKDSAAALRVLEKCGFAVCGQDRGFANARCREVDKWILRLEKRVTPAGDPYRVSASLYDFTVGPLNTGMKRRRLRLAPPVRGMKVLDVGCGTGTDLELYSRGGCEVCGIDLSAAMLKAARKRLGGGADLRLGDAALMPFRDKTFDLVLSTFTLHEMSREKRIPVLVEAIRVMKDRGRLLLTDFQPGPYRFPAGWTGRAVICILEILAGRAHLRSGLDFVRRGGLPALTGHLKLNVEKWQPAAGGAVALYLLTSGGLAQGRKK